MKKCGTILVVVLLTALALPVLAQPRVFMAYDGANGKMCAVARNNQVPFNAVVTYRQSNPGGMIGEISEYWPAATLLWAEAPISPIDPNRMWDVPDGALNIIQTQVDYYDRNTNEFLFTEYAYDTLVAEVEGDQGRYIYDNGCVSVLPDSIPCPVPGRPWSYCAFICHGTYVIPICCEAPGYDPNRLEVTVQNGCGPYTHCNSDPECPQIDWNLFTWYKRVFSGCRLYLVMTYCNGNPGCICIWRSDFYLPVEINGFNAVPGNRQVTINWSVASETDILEYRITRSEFRDDGYVAVGAVTAGRPNGGTYSFVDDHVVNGTTYYYKLHVVDADGNHVYNDGNGAVVVEATPGTEVPVNYSLAQNYPNPFNATTTFSFGLPASEHVSLKVYDLMGREVATVVDARLAAGTHNVNWTADGLATGVYMYKMTAGTYNATKKLLLVK